MLAAFVLHSLYGQFNIVQSFILLLKILKRFSFFNIFWEVIPEFCPPPKFKTVSLTFLYNLIICFSMQLFLLKSYEWSLNLKISVIISGATLLFTLNQGVTA